MQRWELGKLRIKYPIFNSDFQFSIRLHAVSEWRGIKARRGEEKKKNPYPPNRVGAIIITTSHSLFFSKSIWQKCHIPLPSIWHKWHIYKTQYDINDIYMTKVSYQIFFWGILIWQKCHIISWNPRGDI